ncbi:MAG: hypothetical protein EOM22_16505 [Gammaproteobacteria bacterium]|nr:hypothetical protein [Gammaproteobacteria bacterium]
MQRTFKLDVDGVGVFTVKRRTVLVEIEIAAEINRLLGGQDAVSNWLAGLVATVATLKVQLVDVPKDFDIDALDPDDPESYDLMNRVYRAVKAKEGEFRSGKRAAGKSEDAVEDVSMGIQEAVEPGAD